MENRDDMEPERHWIKVGTNAVYVYVVGGGVRAVVYRTASEVGTDEDGEPTIADAGWFWFPVERSNEHSEVVLPDVEIAPERRGSLDPEHDLALDIASDQIEEHMSSTGEADGASGD